MTLERPKGMDLTGAQLLSEQVEDIKEYIAAPETVDVVGVDLSQR
jgi:hypothetical protein